MKKTLSLILTICMVFVGVVSFSVPVFASGRTFGEWHSDVVTINVSASDISYTTPSVVAFNVSETSDYQPVTMTDMSSSNVHGFTTARRDISTFDFYSFANSVAITGGLDSATMDGFQIQLTDFSSSNYSSSRIGSLALVIGSNTSIANNQSVAVINQPFVKAGQSSFFVPADIVGPTAWYFWVHGSGAVETAYIPAASSSSIQYSRPRYTVNISFTFRYRWYSDNLASSSDIQKQTDDLTNGYDNSSMSSDNTRLNNQIAQYDQAQESATNTSVSNIDAAEFINPSSNTSVFAAMTFSASFLQSLYNNLGDFGIVVMVSLSLCLGLMLVGWFKYRKGG
jgi:hypothetical protein